jgi:WD40 repeat protein/DNA-binding SARP family transcriptional activator
MGIDPSDLLQFRVLGPLEVWRDGRRVPLGGERQRALLALLLMHANGLVRTEQLADELLGEEASHSAPNTTRVAISRLRRVLGDDEGGGVVETRPGGYVLVVGENQLDAARFERLLDDGRRLLAAGDAASAASRLAEALDLWRGPALADLASLDAAQPEIRRLEELRLVAMMERIEADLALGRDAELVGELESLVASHPLQERLSGQLMLALYRAGRQSDALAVYRQIGELLRDELGLQPGRALQDLERSILQHDPAVEADGQHARICPFKGLAFFDRADADYFCGRGRIVADLIARLAESTLVGIVGPSGIGKSSLLRAGVLHALNAGVLPGSAGWHQALLRPGEHPCEELARALGGDRLPAVLERLAPGRHVILAVDQLEELFTACLREEDRVRFLEQLVAAAADAERRVLVVVALRADFYGRCASYAAFARMLSEHHVLVGPMGRDELADAVELPADRAGLRVERPLVEALVDDVAGEPGGLPLFSTALLELWRSRSGRVLSYDSYRASGGVHGAVARLADRAYARLGEQDQRIARSLMLRLASGEPDAVVRRRVPRSELEQIDGADGVLARLIAARLLTADEGEVEVAHEALFTEWPRFRGWLDEDRVGRRLQAHLTAGAREWDARGRDPGDLYRGARLAAAIDWAAHHADRLNPLEREFVARSRAVAEREARRQRAQNRRLRSLLAGVAVLLGIAVVAGIVALAKQHSASSKARAEQAARLGAEAVSEPRIDLAMLLAREAVNLDQTRQTQSTLLATLLRSPATLATITLPIQARPQRLALSPDGKTLAVSDNIGGIRFYDAGTRRQRRPPLTDRGYGTAVYAADGSLLVVPAAGRVPGLAGPLPGLDVYDARTYTGVAHLRLDRGYAARQPLPGADFTLVSPDSRSLLYAYNVQDRHGLPGAAYLDRWSLPGGRLVASTRLAGAGGVLGARLLAGAKRLVVLRTRSTAVLDLDSLRSVRVVGIVPPAPPRVAAISPDGRRAVLGSATGSVAFVDLRTGAVTPAAGGHSAPVQNATFSRDGRVVVTAGDDARVIVWDAATAQPREALSGHGGRVVGLSLSADGRTLYTCSLDGTILEWDLGGQRRFGRPFQTAAHLPPPGPDTTPSPPLTLAPDGAAFATRVAPRQVGIFSATTLHRENSFPTSRATREITSLSWSPSGATLAVAGYDGTLQLWDVRGRPRLQRALPGMGSPNGLPEVINSVAFGRDVVAAVDTVYRPGAKPQDGRLALWDPRSGRLLAAPLALGRQGWSVALSPRGDVVAVGLDDDRVLVVGARNGRIHRILRPIGAPIVSVAFAPDGTLATGSWAGIVQRWDPATGAQLSHPVLVAPAPVASISFDPRGDTYATSGGSDGTAKLWTDATGQQLGATFEGDPGHWGTAQYTPDGKRLIVVYDDGKGFAWPVTVAAWQEHACAVAGRSLSREEWNRYVAAGGYQHVCP